MITLKNIEFLIENKKVIVTLFFLDRDVLINNILIKIVNYYYNAFFRS